MRWSSQAACRPLPPSCWRWSSPVTSSFTAHRSYAATETLIGRILGRFGVHWLDFPAGATRDEIDAAMTKAKTIGHVALVYLESPANPTNALVDVEAVKGSRDAAFAADDLPPIAIDNTFLGAPVGQAPEAGGGPRAL